MRGDGVSTHVIRLTQLRVDGAVPSTLDAIVDGATLSWHGEAIRLDGAGGLLLLEPSPEIRDLRRRASSGADRLRRALGAPVPPSAGTPMQDDPRLVVTDGLGRWEAVAAPSRHGPLLVWEGGLPPRARELTVLHSGLRAHQAAPAPRRSPICFTPGTLVSTPDGPRAIETLDPGDLVATRDDGPQPILWVGLRHVSGARLFAEPSLRPVRIRADAMEPGRPRPDLLVSPSHRVLIAGRRPDALFGAPEVLARAADLVDGRGVRVDHASTSVTYVHLLLPRHSVIWANGLPCESFHPGEADLGHLNSAEREELEELAPGAAADPLAYGDPARRCLTAGEAAILRHDGGPVRLG